MFWNKKEEKVPPKEEKKISEAIEVLLSQQIKKLDIRLTQCEADVMSNAVGVQNITDKVLRRLKVRADQVQKAEEETGEPKNINTMDYLGF